MADATHILDGVNVVSMLGGGLGVALIQAAGRAYTQRTQRAGGIDDVLASALAHEQQEHKATRNELSQSRTNESVALSQAATFGAQLEGAIEDIAQLKSDRDEDRARNEDCERRYADVSERLRRVERRVTPEAIPAVESSDRIRPPVMHGGYSNGKR